VINSPKNYCSCYCVDGVAVAVMNLADIMQQTNCILKPKKPRDLWSHISKRRNRKDSL